MHSSKLKTKMLTVMAALALALPLTSHSAIPVAAGDMMAHVDLQSDAFTKAEMSRADIEALIAKVKPGETVNLYAKSLNGLDLSGMDLRRVNLQAARINNANLSNTNLEGVVLDQAWLLKTVLTGSNIKNASLFGTQMLDAKMDNVDFTGALIAADMTRASLKNAIFDGANLSAGENQSMGLMRGNLASTDLRGASFKGSNLWRAAAEYADMRGADFTNANLVKAELGGANLTGANVTGADFELTDVNSAKLTGMIGVDKAKNLKKAMNYDRAFTDK